MNVTDCVALLHYFMQIAVAEEAEIDGSRACCELQALSQHALLRHCSGRCGRGRDGRVDERDAILACSSERQSSCSSMHERMNCASCAAVRSMRGRGGLKLTVYSGHGGHRRDVYAACQGICTRSVQRRTLALVEFKSGRRCWVIASMNAQ